MTTKIKSGVISDNAITSAHISSGAISSSHLTGIDTDAVSEGSSNLYFTTTRARTSLSVTDSGGDGSLAYDNSTGAITYTGPSAAEVRAHISVTDSGGDGSLAYSNGVITYTGPSASEVRAHLSAGTGVTYSSGEFSIGQSVATTASPTFADINITGDLNLTGDINSYSVTDLDIVDQTITLGVGQSESASDGSGIVIAGSSASILWDEPNDEFDFNKGINVTGNIVVSGTVDGVDIAARDAILTSTTTTAGAALPLAGGTMTGDIAMGANQIIFDNNSQAILIKDAAGTASYVLYQDNADTLILGNNTNVEKIRLDTNGNEGAVVVDTSGKVGISTTASLSGSDYGMLTIKKTGSNIFGDSAITINSADTNQSTLALGLTGSVAYIDSTESGSGTVLPLAFATGSTEKMRIDTSGNIKFGATGDGYISGTAPNTYNSGYSQDNDSWATWMNYHGYQDGTSRYRDFIVGDGKQGRIATFDGSSGNVGIGIDNPTSALMVTGGATVPGISIKSGGNSGVDPFRVTYVSGTEGDMFIIDDNGNVGINNTSPVAKLHVQGTGTSGQVTSSFLLENASSGTAGMDIIGAAGSSRLRVLYGGGPSTGTNTLTEALNIVLEGSSAGNVGMGTNSPIASVHIKPAGNSWEHSLLLQHSASNTGWNIHPETQDNSLWFGYNADTSVALTSQTANEYLVLDSSGGVGIGNNRPTINAHAAANNLVIGNTSTGDNGMTILGNASNTGRIFFGDPDLNREGQIEYVHNGDYFQFYASNALSFIAEEGQIGIGINPSETLHMYKASGSNEIRNQLGNNSVYMRHGVNRNSPQGSNVFDILGLQNQDIVIGTSNMFLVGDGGFHNSEGSNRLRVDGNGVTIGEVLPTLTTTNESLDRRLWVRGQGTFDSQSAGTNPRNDNSALYLGPRTTRDTSATNPGTAGYDDVQPSGSLMGGIAWDHLKNYSTYGNVGYSTRPHGWLGMELHSTPGYELSNMVMATREGVGSTDEAKTAMRWYATGEITTPRNPAFAAYGSGMANQTTEGNHGSWNETIDRGANFTAGTNAYFTAPVDGLYAFWVHCNFNTGSSVPYYWRAFKNTGGIGIFYGAGANQSWDHVMGYIMVAMDKNDTFEWKYKGDPDEGAEWAQCGGYLVG